MIKTRRKNQKNKKKKKKERIQGSKWGPRNVDLSSNTVESIYPSTQLLNINVRSLALVWKNSGWMFNWDPLAQLFTWMGNELDIYQKFNSSGHFLPFDLEYIISSKTQKMDGAR